MDAAASITDSLVTLVLGIFFSLTFYQVFMTNRTQAFSESVGIKLVPELRSSVQRRLATRYRGIAFGGLAGLLAGEAIVARDRDKDIFFSLIVVGGMILAGVALGAAVSSLFGRARRDPEAVKYARTRVVELDDYVPALELWPARIGVMLSVAALVIAIIIRTDVTLPLVLTVIGVAALLFFEIVGRRIVARPQQAESPRELGWDDALRSSVLRDMVLAPLAISLFSLMLTLVAIFGSVQPTSIIFVLSLTVLSRFTARSRPQRHFLRRLWDAPA